MLRLRDIMTTDVIAVGPATTLREAADLLSERHIGGVPVVDGATLVGVVSATDILAFAAAATERPAEPDDTPAWEPWEERDAWAEDEDEPQARYLAEQAANGELEVVDEISERAPAGDLLDGHTVGEVMTRRVVALPPSADVVTAANRLRAADVHRLLVVDGGKLVGVVTTSDIARAVADGRVVRRTYVFDTSPVDRDHDGGEF